MSVTEMHTASAVRTQHLLSDFFGGFDQSDFAVRLWDGSQWRPQSSKGRPSFTMVLNHPGSLRRMFERPSMLSLREAFLSRNVDIEGDLLAACELGDHLLRLKPSIVRKAKLALELRRLPAAPKSTEGHPPASLSGRVGSRRRLREAISYHYDLPAEFWKEWLDTTLAYSCAYFKEESDSLDQAQLNKLDYVCRKLYLKPGERLLDLGCGWGGLAMFAARNYGVNVTAITLSRKQFEYASGEVAKRGLENVPAVDLPAFFAHASSLLKPGGLFFNHGITASSVRLHPSGPSFVDAYVFPDHGVTTISQQLAAAEEMEFEVRDVECLREHYMRTCGEWLKRIEEHEQALIRHSNVGTQRLFRLYVAAQMYYFRTGASSIHQALFVKSDRKPSGLPLTRADWYAGGTSRDRSATENT
jgi:cyclopropane-fatty-acyl-phospholipid synthase